MTSFDQLMHRAPRGQAEPVERPPADLGIGRGGGAASPRREEPFDVRFNRELREALGVVTRRIPLDALADPGRKP